MDVGRWVAYEVDQWMDEQMDGRVGGWIGE